MTHDGVHVADVLKRTFAPRAGDRRDRRDRRGRRSGDAVRALHPSRPSARSRYALGSLSIALAMGVLVPAATRVLSIDARTATFLVAAVLLLIVGVLLGSHVDALEKRTLEDPMTCVANRRHLEERLRLEIRRALESRMPLSMVMVDLDNLKGLNDAHGHACGDRALSVVAEVLRDTCRSRDLAARFGGDEFVVLLPRTRASEAKSVAARIRVELARRTASAGLPEGARVTVSMGIADLDLAEAPERLFEASDRALYAAKSKGRDRIEIEKRAHTSTVIRLDDHRAARKGGSA